MLDGFFLSAFLLLGIFDKSIVIYFPASIAITEEKQKPEIQNVSERLEGGLSLSLASETFFDKCHTQYILQEPWKLN